VLRHEIESVKILPRTGRNDPALYGDITLSAAALIEIEDPARPRVFSLSVTDEKCPRFCRSTGVSSSRIPPACVAPSGPPTRRPRTFRADPHRAPPPRSVAGQPVP
jgi:hypothetical protein